MVSTEMGVFGGEFRLIQLWKLLLATQLEGISFLNYLLT